MRLAGASGASARAVLEERSWGTAVALEVRGLANGTTYGAWLAGPDGARVSAGTFRPDAAGTATLHLAASLPREASTGLGVTALDGADVLSTTLPAR